jgi:hypothetical protein
MTEACKEKVVHTPVLQIKDEGRVQMGYMTPSFPPVRRPAIRVDDKGKVRMGYMTPAFPPGR